MYPGVAPTQVYRFTGRIYDRMVSASAAALPYNQDFAAALLGSSLSGGGLLDVASGFLAVERGIFPSLRRRRLASLRGFLQPPTWLAGFAKAAFPVLTVSGR
ncbi:hypothetical protein NDU88_005946 [Pleurodeles waltl]|uniref:Uncharacterized protein n=1 Tax=Pleurodeles waltl TaxID=8319 RepID=A0AAV7ULK8_PLEWA|nr:hypothetical protein NDU88_005946 [Pleurodeles waltl]